MHKNLEDLKIFIKKEHFVKLKTIGKLFKSEIPEKLQRILEKINFDFIFTLSFTFLLALLESPTLLSLQ